MKTGDKGAIVGTLFVMLCMYAAVQYNFISYYQHMGMPFGAGDVDYYMKDISKPSLDLSDHVLMIMSAKIASYAMPPGEFLTFLIPIMLCLLLPISIFMMAFMLSGDGTIAFYSTLVSIFGTMMMMAFGISAMWAQLEATILVIWFIVMLEAYLKSKSKEMLVFAFALSVLTVAAHYKFAIFIPLYLMMRYLVEGHKGVVISAAVLCIIAFILSHGRMMESYAYEVDAGYVFVNFMFPLLWILAFYYIAVGFSDSSKMMRASMLLSLTVLVLSSQVVMWRPLLTVLPLFSLFATLGLFRIMNKTDPKTAIATGVMVILILMAFSFYMMQNFMFTMYGEMVPGVYNDTRTSVNAAEFSKMYFPNSRIQVTGYVTVIGNTTTETAKIVNNGSPQIIGIINVNLKPKTPIFK